MKCHIKERKLFSLSQTERNEITRVITNTIVYVFYDVFVIKVETLVRIPKVGDLSIPSGDDSEKSFICSDTVLGIKPQKRQLADVK